jgi:hypothetical protein
LTFGLAVVDVGVAAGTVDVLAAVVCSLSEIMPRASYSARWASTVGLAVNGRTAWIA